MRAARCGTAQARVFALHETCKKSLAAFDIQVQVEGVRPASGLLVSNHLSYLDILVYSAIVPCAFVSKAEVAHWAVIGHYAIQGGTIFVRREKLLSSRHANQQIVEYLKDGVAVVLFPEGTTTDGARVLRFHSSMLQPAIDAGVAVTPCAMRYEVSGGSESDAAWWGDMTLAPHAWKLLGKASIRAQVCFGEPLSAIRNRKLLSDEGRSGVIACRKLASGALSV